MPADHATGHAPTAAPPGSGDPMGAVRDAVRELRYITSCRCDDAWTGRQLHETHCITDYREDVETLAAALNMKDDAQ